MSELIMNTNTLPEFLFRMIPTVKVRVKEVGGEIRLIPIKESAKRPRSEFIGMFEGRIWMSDDFDEPLDDFKEYME